MDTPIADELHGFLHSLEPQHQLNWQPGGCGKGFFDQDGAMHTWPVDQNYEPNHVQHGGHNGIDFTAPYLFIHPDGSYQAYRSEDAPQQAAKISQIDPRLSPHEDEPLPENLFS